MTSVSFIMRNIWPEKIRAQLVIGIALVLLVLMSVFVAGMVQRQRNFLKNQNHEHAFSFLNDYADNSSPFILARDFDGLERLTLSHGNFPNLEYAMILSPEGKVLAHSQPKYIGSKPSDSISRQLIKGQGHQVLVENDRVLDIGAFPFLRIRS
jgi:hypothetical protein